MNNVVAIARRELRTYFNSPIAYIVLGVFLVTAGWLFFFYSGLFIVGRATLRPFFSVAPLLFMLLAPAITMRLVAEERKTGTLESLLTLPVREWEVVVGKLTAALGMVAVGLLFTIPFPITLAALTAPGFTFDWGPVLGGYVGLVLLAGAFLSVGMWASAISKNQIVGFIVGLAACFVLWILDKATVILPQGLASIFEYLSVTYHFENFAKGVFDSRDFIYYASVIAIGVVLTVRALQSVRGGISATTMSLATIGSLVLLNVIAVGAFFRVDLTQDRAFTLAEATKTTVAQLKDPVVVTAYFTKDLPPPFSSNARYVKDLLDEYRARSGGNVSYEFLDPAEAKDDAAAEPAQQKVDVFGRPIRQSSKLETEIEALGIRPVEVKVIEKDQRQTKRGYMGLVLRYGEKTEVIPVVQGVDSLEYDLTTMIRRLTREKTPVLGVLQGHGELSPEGELQRLMPLLQQNYDVKPVTLAPDDKGALAVPAEYDALLVLGPKQEVPPEQIAAIDQFVMKGKAAAFFLDRVDVDYRSFAPTPAPHGLDALVGAWGIELGPQLVADVNSANLSMSEKRGFMVIQRPVPYPFIPTVKSLEVQSPTTKGVSDITLPFAAPLYMQPKDGVELVALAKSSAKSWLEDPTPEALQVGRDYAAGDIVFTGPYSLIVQAKGALPSYTASVAGAAAGPDVLAKAQGEARVVVVGTSGFLDPQVLSPQNAALLLNIVDWLLTDPALLEMRSRGLADAPLQAELSDGARGAAKFGNTIGVPLLLIGYGLVRWRLRENKRARLRGVG
jgi:gliding-associated putative ABC transporter substrate-binding component GldG